MDATSLLESEMTRIGDRIKALETERDGLRQARAEIARKTGLAKDAAGSDAVESTLSHLKIEEEQAAEHDKFLEHNLRELRKRLDVLAEDLEAIRDGSVT